MHTRARARAEAALRALHSPNINTLPPELIVVHVLPYLTNGEKGALAKTCGRLFRLLRHERAYRLSSLSTRKYLEDAAFREEVNARIPAGKLALRPFECAMRAFHFAPFAWKRARTLFEEVLADKTATEVEKARAHLSLHVLHSDVLGGIRDEEAMVRHKAAARARAPLLLAGDERDPVRAFEMGYCYLEAIGTKWKYRKAHALFVSSANGGCTAGVFYVGICLFYGFGVKLDESAGAAQFERAAAMGHYRAMFLFGECLFHEWGVSPDEARGVALIRSAAVDEGCWFAKQWLRWNEDYLRSEGLW